MTSKLLKTLNLTILLLAAPGAWAETIDCTPITTLPTIITVQGIYCFTGNLATSMATGRAIDIRANNVVIDLNGRKLGGLAAGAGTLTTGIYAFQRKNITIRNGSIRGFHTAIFLDDPPPYTTSQSHLIEDIRADGNTFMAFGLRGLGIIVRRNQVVGTGGSTVSGDATGIQFDGPGARLLNNDISSTVATGTGYAFAARIGEGDGAVVEGNRIDDVSSGTGFTFGLHISFSADVLVRENSITSVDKGVVYNSSTGKYMDNLTSGVTTPFTGGTAVGTNN